jgi:hypothetical protein
VTDYLRKPAPGTQARETYDARHTTKRRMCACGRAPARHGLPQCLACDPATKDRFAALTQFHKGSKQ